MIQLGGTVGADFVIKGLNLTGPTQPTDAERAIFDSETKLDTAIGSLHATKDKPYLTMNDKVYAARFSVAVVTPLEINPTAVVSDTPNNEWTKDQIRAWLEGYGVMYTDGAFDHLTKDELLDAVQDVLSP